MSGVVWAEVPILIYCQDRLLDGSCIPISSHVTVDEANYTNEKGGPLSTRKAYWDGVGEPSNCSDNGTGWNPSLQTQCPRNWRVRFHLDRVAKGIMRIADGMYSPHSVSVSMVILSFNGYSFDNAGGATGGSHPIHLINGCDVVKGCNARSE